MSHETPLISVIIPVYNGDAFLAEAVESVRRQAYEMMEIIVVDDGSTDRTAEVATGMGSAIRYYYQENGGPAAARNRGVNLSAGKIIGFLDADDLWTPRKLATQMDLLSQNPSVEIVVGQKQYIMAASAANEDYAFKKTNEVRTALNLGCSLFRKSIFDTVGLFDEAMRHCDDWDWFMRAREQGVSILMHEDIMLYYRRHDSNMTNQIETGNRYALRMIKKSLDRRRQSGSMTPSLPDLPVPGGTSIYQEEDGNGSS